MDEAEWLVSDDPAAMLDYLLRADCTHAGERGRIKPSDRKLRLFADACRHSFYHGYLIRQGVWSGSESAGHLQSRRRDEALPAERAARCWASEMAVAERPKRASFLRDLAGNPWRPAGDWSPEPNFAREHGLERLPPKWLRPLLIPTARALATAAYAERLPDGLLAPDRLAVLADALEDGGCDEKSLLCHLRGYGDGPGWPVGRPTGPHARGCWALDLVLGKD